MTSAVANTPKRPQPHDLPQPLLAGILMDMARHTPTLQNILSDYVGPSCPFQIHPMAVTLTPLEAYRSEAFQTYSFPADDSAMHAGHHDQPFFHLGLSASACDDLLEAALGGKSGSLPMNSLASSANATPSTQQGPKFTPFEMVWLNALLHEWVEGVIKPWLKPVPSPLSGLNLSEQAHAGENQAYLYLQWLINSPSDAKQETVAVLMLACPKAYLLTFYKACFGPDAARYPTPIANEVTREKLQRQLARCRSDAMQVRIGQTRMTVGDLTQLDRGDVVVLEHSRLDRFNVRIEHQSFEFPIIPPEERRI